MKSLSFALPALPWALLVLHAAASVLAAFRLTELMLLDKLTEPIRRRWGKVYLFGCPRCMSVWCGAVATLVFALLPWLNWPLALSWLYIVLLDRRNQRRQPAAPAARAPQARRSPPTATWDHLQKGKHVMSTPNDAPRPLDPALAAKLAQLQAQNRPQPAAALPVGLDQAVQNQLGAMMLQLLRLQAENEALRGRNRELEGAQQALAAPSP